MVITRRRITVSVLALALPISAAACGGGTHVPTTTSTTVPTTTTTAAPADPRLLAKAAYVREMRLLGRQIGTEVSTIYPIDTGVHGSGAALQTAKRIEHVHAVFEEVLTTLRSITPPAKVAADHRRLEAGVQGVAAELAQVINDLEAGDFEGVAVPSRLSDLSVIDTATSSMEKKGFDVLSEHTGP